jgi:hypothetical protein
VAGTIAVTTSGLDLGSGPTSSFPLLPSVQSVFALFCKIKDHYKGPLPERDECTSW